jgi:hypothetical protein
MHQKKQFNMTVKVVIQLRAGNPTPQVLQRATAGVLDMYTSGVSYGQAQGFDAQMKDVTLVEVQEAPADTDKYSARRKGKARVSTPAGQPVFTMGAWVGWESQSGGRTSVKNGEVVHIVPAGELPPKDAFPSLHRKGIGQPRAVESYVVSVEGVPYWPRITLLKAA